MAFDNSQDNRQAKQEADMSETKPTKQSIIEGSLAIALGGSVAATIVGAFEAFGHFMPAKFESGFGTTLGILGYIFFKILRK